MFSVCKITILLLAWCAASALGVVRTSLLFDEDISCHGLPAGGIGRHFDTAQLMLSEVRLRLGNLQELKLSPRTDPLVLSHLAGAYNAMGLWPSFEVKDDG